MAKSVMVIGLGRFGSSLASNLFQQGYDVLGIDKDEKVVQDHLGLITYSVQGDATDEGTLKDLGVSNFDAAIVAVGTDMQVNLMASVLLGTLEVPLIIARAKDNLHAVTLGRIGVHKVIYVEQEMGETLAHSLFNPDVLEYMDLTSEFGISKIRLPDNLAGKSINEVGLGGIKDKNGVSVLAIMRGRNVTLAPEKDDKLQGGDILVVAGNDDQVEKLHTA